MEKTLVTSGKTIDLAIESALAQLGLDRDSVSVQVLQQAKSGFLGFGPQLARMRKNREALFFMSSKYPADRGIVARAGRKTERVSEERAVLISSLWYSWFICPPF